MNNKNELILFDKGTQELNTDNHKYIFVTSFDDAGFILFFEKFTKMDSDKNVKVIPIVISSYGGEVYSLLSMLDLIATASKPVSTIALGKAMSCGAILLASGTKGYRYSSPSTHIMVHEVSSLAWGKDTEIKNSSEQTSKLNKQLFDFLQSKSNLKDKNWFLKELKAKGNTDWYFTSDQFKKLGLIDFVSIPKMVVK